MNAFTTLLVLGLGIGLDAVYNKMRRNAENKAYNCGYRQARKEERMRYESEFPLLTQNNYRFESDQEHIHEAEKEEIHIPESFMENLKNNGRAVARIR